MGDQEMKYYSSSSYARLGRRWWRRPAAARGFRLIPTRRLSVRRLRARLWTLLGILGRCVRSVRLLTRGLVVPSGGGGSTSPSARGKGRRALAVLGGGKDVVAAASGGGKLHADGTAGGGNNKAAARRPPCMRSNSFYARAVAECLEFIKGSNSNAGGGGGATPARDNRVK
ncbi:hypothetical protein DAI22_06g139200 [Oryza sativa Japonica Group]|jgi:hypothetical protein|nr:hypothetical protein DAI22_06g139200 [Oryza sativa Japonica Group]